MCRRKMILPKCWIAAVPKYWNSANQVPTGYPETSSEFSMTYTSEETAAAVTTMEESLNTENSIITEEMVPVDKIVGSYLGTYDVQGVADELVLISPEEVPAGTVGVIAMHYNEESQAWEKIEDAQIIDGYVYGTLSSFSPIAVFTLKRDSFYDAASEVAGCALFVANGLPVVITKNEAGEVVAKDSNGKETVIPENTIIVGGTVDGTDIESTSIYAKGISATYIIGGSICADKEKSAKIEEVNIELEECDVTETVIGGACHCQVENLNIVAKNCKLLGDCYVGASRSNWNQGGTANGNDNTAEGLGIGCPGYTRNARITLENCETYLVYAGGISGNSYTALSNVKIIGGSVEYLCACASNGLTDDITVVAENAKIKNVQTANRGVVKVARVTLKNCEAEHVYVAGDSADSSVTGTVETVKMEIINGGKATLYPGTINGVAMDAEVAKEVVEYVKIGRTTEITYMDDVEAVLGEALRLK